ncbi:MAG: GldG family protein [Nevskiaceae bacterium]
MSRGQVLAQQLLSAALFVAVVGMLAFLTQRYKVEADWTAGNRNMLTESSRKLLASLPDPIAFKLFVYPRSETRPALESDIRRYQRVKPDITVEFIDPAANPQKVRDYSVQRAGEAVVEYQGRRESLGATTEQAITSALQRLSYAGENWVVFLEGHGERSINDSEQGGFGEFAQMLRDKGLKVQGLSLVKSPKVPDNTSVLVIAAPRSRMLDGEARLIAEYVERGGNLLWLTDPDGPVSPDALAKALGVTWLDGIVIDPVALQLGMPAGFFVPGHYPPNAAVAGLDMLTVFPLARAVKASAEAGWNGQPLLETQPEAWVETAKDKVNPDDKDVHGPVAVGLTLTREHKPAGAGEDAKARPQRVVLIGDADFAGNGYFGQQGNSLLAINLVQWLALRDEQINVDVPKAPDVALVIPAWGVYAINFGFVLVLPLALLGFGVTRWVIRRRA